MAQQALNKKTYPENTACGCGYDHNSGKEHCYGDLRGHQHEEAQEHQHKHKHEHGEVCGCHHDHHSSHGQDEHHHGENCSCGHTHGSSGHGSDGHSHENSGHSGDGHSHDALEQREVNHAFDHVQKQVYILENLGCANCAAKMERKIQELPQVDFANIIFATKQLQVVTNTEEELLPVFQEICSSIENEVTVLKRDRKPTRQQTASKGKFSENKKDFWEIGIGAVFMAGGILTETVSGNLSLILFLAGYLVLGRAVLFTAAKNLGKGHVFDENFLMSIATLGAFLISEYPEAVGVMLILPRGGTV